MMKSATQQAKHVIPENFNKLHRKNQLLKILQNSFSNNEQYLLQFDGRGNPGVSGCGSVIYYRGNEIWNRSVYLEMITQIIMQNTV